jgi:hypothetical protein
MARSLQVKACKLRPGFLANASWQAMGGGHNITTRANPEVQLDKLYAELQGGSRLEKGLAGWRPGVACIRSPSIARRVLIDGGTAFTLIHT